MGHDGERFVVFIGKADTSAQIAPRPQRLTRLDRQAHYRINLVNRLSIPALSRGTPLLKEEDMVVSGAWLMSHGPSVPWSFPCHMWVIEGERV
jgi:alpha-galactosidase